MSKLREQLVRKLQRMGVEERTWPGRDDGFSSLEFAGKDFAHFHNDGELDIRLGRNLIKREGLVHPPDSKVHPGRSQNSQWIEIRFTTPQGVEKIVDLVRLVIAEIAAR